ncbi:mannose-6-phosphate isomerase [Erysipelotrichaceae bacterium OPF54]|mgnify:FL=1|jgi:mannose-6-phosphate isomerase class I|nr:class I mannose-6-phosphate isomerase [uncultured Dubosiella sp.]GJM56567.1 mannose-6-phosphate isomerase [Erysipelotrichaceae bacterium OPF54]GJM59398.1 mannose-6-phosphate isomerase [Erysipelotrichaceae bacterium OPF54]
MMKSLYDPFPKTRIKGYDDAVIHGWDAIVEDLDQNGGSTLVFDAYPGVFDEEVKKELKRIPHDVWIDALDMFKDGETIKEQLKYNITDDRIFGRMYYGEIDNFIVPEKLEELRDAAQESAAQGKRVLVYGYGAGLIASGTLVYLDMARWEITLRYRNGMPNFLDTNYDEDALRKIKRGFFIEWRVADKHKRSLFDSIDYFLDTNNMEDVKLVKSDAVRAGLEQMAHRPFRLVPYFDPGVWGGQWMKEVCNLDPDKENYAWSFDGVPEENSIYLDFGNGHIELPAMDLVLYEPKPLLGPSVYSRFGAEFPIRFDFLDTIGGQNLSLQVHPLTEYIHRTFGMAYTQDESYYILDAKEGASVYLGLKEGINKDQMIEDLYAANRGEILFDAEKYINRFPAKKHDHFLIPAGTCHCSGSDAMVLEISATPYCFTFKMWDWARVGLDGLPRPVHIDHGKKNIQWDRTTKWVEKNLVNAIHTVKEDDHVKEEHTGLHELEFIETRRLWIKDEAVVDNEDNVNMLNLIEGQKAYIESLDGSFEPFEVHYAETFIVPASVKGYRIVNPTGDTIGVLRAYVRKTQA